MTGIITLALGIVAKVANLSLMDTVDWTYVWTHSEDFPHTLVQLHRGTIMIFSNRTRSLEGGLALMKKKLKEKWQAWSWAQCLCCVAIGLSHLHS